MNTFAVVSIVAVVIIWIVAAFRFRQAVFRETDSLDSTQRSLYSKNERPSARFYVVFMLLFGVLVAIKFASSSSWVDSLFFPMCALLACVESWLNRRRIIGFVRSNNFPNRFIQAVTRSTTFASVSALILVVAVTGLPLAGFFSSE